MVLRFRGNFAFTYTVLLSETQQRLNEYGWNPLTFNMAWQLVGWNMGYTDEGTILIIQHGAVTNLHARKKIILLKKETWFAELLFQEPELSNMITPIWNKSDSTICL